MCTKSTSALAKALFALLLLTSTSLLANPTAPAKPTSFDASMYITKANKIRLAVEKTTTQPLTINLRQVGKNDVLFTQQIGRRQTKVALEINVDQLTDGVYELEIKSATGSIVKQLNLATTTPQITTERIVTLP